MNSRLLDIEQVHLAFVRLCIERGVRYLFHGGDLYHKRNPTQTVIHRSLSWIELAIQHDICVVLVPGNHDYNYIQHAMAHLARPSLVSERIKFVADLKMFQIGPDKIPVLAIPFARPEDFSQQEVEEWITDLPSEGVVFGHAQPSRALPGIEGTFNERDPIILSSSVLAESRAELLLGHIHDRQAHVLGSCMCLSFDDSHDKFGWIGQHGGVGEFVRLDQPVYHTIHVNATLQHPLEALEQFAKQNVKAGMVRLKVEQADEGFGLDPGACQEALGQQLRLTQHHVSRRETKITAPVIKDVSLKSSLERYQEENQYRGTGRAAQELEILAEATGVV